MTGDEDEIVAELSDPVRGALDEAPALVAALLADLTQDDKKEDPE
jgi:hypothetical protein